MVTNQEKGTQLEFLIERLQKLLVDENVKVKWNDFVTGKISGSRRQLDVTLRGMGDNGNFIVLECRNYSDPQEVDWIEQLASKKLDIGADRIIAVSSSGFTSGAINTAKEWGIELRILDKITDFSNHEWFRVRHVIVQAPVAKIYQFKLILSREAQEAFNSYANQYLNETTHFAIISKSKGISVNADEILETVSEQNPYISAGLPDNGEHIFHNFIVDFDTPSPFQMWCGRFRADIRHIEIKADVWLDVSKQPINYLFQYKEYEGEILCELVEAEVDYWSRVSFLE